MSGWGDFTKWVKTIYDLAKKVNDLLEAHQKSTAAIKKLSDDLQEVRIDIERLKAREEIIGAKAGEAAARAATAGTNDLSRRLGQIEGLLGGIRPQEVVWSPPKALPPPPGVPTRRRKPTNPNSGDA